MLHEVTDSEGELEDELKEKFHDGFEGEDDVIANADNHDMKILFGDHQKPRNQ